jgi:hypothetical protein
MASFSRSCRLDTPLRDATGSPPAFEAGQRMGYNHQLVMCDGSAAGIFLEQGVEDYVGRSVSRSGPVRWGTPAIPCENTPTLPRHAVLRVLPVLC